MALCLREAIRSEMAGEHIGIAEEKFTPSRWTCTIAMHPRSLNILVSNLVYMGKKYRVYPEVPVASYKSTNAP